MSRCFPFPPPGYERKLRVDDDNLLVKEKEKDKEKRHKKDKNREKKEEKERDKDKSKDRHREKDKDKEKKEKHKSKDKKKDKSQCRDERAGSPNAERVGSNSPRNHFTASSSAQDLDQRISYVGVATRIENGFKINDRDHGRGELLEKPRFDQMVNGQRDNGQTKLPNVAIACNTDGVSKKRAEPMEIDRLVEEKQNQGHQRIENAVPKVNGQRGNGQTRLPKVAIVCNSNGVDKKRAESCRPMEIDRPVEEKQNQGHQRIENGVQNKEKNGKRFERQGIQINGPKDTMFAQELGRRISAENGPDGHQVVARPNSTDQKRIDSNGTIANCDKAISSRSSQSKEVSKFGNGINRKDGDPKVLAINNFKGSVERGHGMVRPVDMGKRASVGAMERNGFSGGVGAIDHKEKKVITNDEVRNKAKTDKTEQGGGNTVNLSRVGRSGSDSKGLSGNASQPALPVSNKSLQGVAVKRKEPETNGFLHENGVVRPIKLPRTVLSPQSNIESGRNLQHSAAITLLASNHGAPASDSLRLGNKDLKVVEEMARAQQSPLYSAKPSTESPLGSSKSPSSVVDTNGTISGHGSPLGPTKPRSEKSKSKSKSKHKDKKRDRSSKSPSSSLHPDAKYLSQIYSMPKLDDWSESIDDEWLSGSMSSQSVETNTDSLTNDGQPQVWAKAINIESLDIYALPYVISC